MKRAYLLTKTILLKTILLKTIPQMKTLLKMIPQMTPEYLRFVPE